MDGLIWWTGVTTLVIIGGVLALVFMATFTHLSRAAWFTANVLKYGGNQAYRTAPFYKRWATGIELWVYYVIEHPDSTTVNNVQIHWSGRVDPWYPA